MRTRSRRSSPDGRSRFPIVVAFLAVALLGAAPPPTAEQNPIDRETVRSLARQVLEAGPYQTKLPEAQDLDSDATNLSWLAPIGRLLSILLPALLVGVLLLFVFWMARDYFTGGALGKPTDGPEVGSASTDSRDARLADPHRLAAEGRYDLAIHALLLLAIGGLSRRSGIDPARSWTSREVARRFPMPAGAREALQALVLTVEISHFGGVDVGLDDFDRCLGHYRAAIGEEPA